MLYPFMVDAFPCEVLLVELLVFRRPGAKRTTLGLVLTGTSLPTIVIVHDTIVAIDIRMLFPEFEIIIIGVFESHENRLLSSFSSLSFITIAIVIVSGFIAFFIAELVILFLLTGIRALIIELALPTIVHYRIVFTIIVALMVAFFIIA